MQNHEIEPMNTQTEYKSHAISKHLTATTNSMLST